MVTPIVMPKFGQMTEDSAIVEWLKKEGDKVAKGDVLFLVETDKSVMEVESFSEGTLLKIAVGVGVSVPVQSVVGYLGEKGEKVPATPAPARQAAAARRARTRPRRRPRAARAPTAAAPAASSPLPRRPGAYSAAPARFRISPRAAALAKDSVIDPHAIVGSGPGRAASSRRT